MPVQHERSELDVQSERVALAAVRLPDSSFDRRDPFGELRALAEQAGCTVAGELSQNLSRPYPATYMGPGKIEELKRFCEQVGATTIIFDHNLTPKQISNIEKATLRKVLDRSELILDIFASRATSAEAKLQVELAQLEYTYPRLKAMWSHLERISGGIGSRGPGRSSYARCASGSPHDAEHPFTRIVLDARPCAGTRSTRTAAVPDWLPPVGAACPGGLGAHHTPRIQSPERGARFFCKCPAAP